MSATAARPLNWNVLTIEPKAPERVARQLEAGDRAAAAGGRVVALTMPVSVPMNMSFNTFCGLWLIPGWQEVLERPGARADRAAPLARGARRRMRASARSPEAGVLRMLAYWDRYVIGDTYAPANDGVRGRAVGDIAAERGQDPFDTLLDIVVADELRTILWPAPKEDEQLWQAAARRLG